MMDSLHSVHIKQVSGELWQPAQEVSSVHGLIIFRSQSKCRPLIGQSMADARLWLADTANRPPCHVHTALTTGYQRSELSFRSEFVQPIRGQYLGHVITLSQSETRDLNSHSAQSLPLGSFLITRDGPRAYNYKPPYSRITFRQAFWD